MRMGYNRRLTYWVLFLVVVLGGCRKDEPIPARLELSPFDFNVQIGQGSSANQFTETWVSINNNFLGAFDPDATVYYLDTGVANIVVSPGIRNNGILNDAIIYPMTTSYSLNTHISPGEILKVMPDTRYRPNTSFSFLCDFETGNPFTDNRDSLASSVMSVSTTDPFEGQNCGILSLTKDSYVVEVAHDISMNDLPFNGTPAYLEVWYKSEISLGIGLVGINVDGVNAFQLMYVTRPTTEWNLLYLDLRDWLFASQLPSYKIAFRGEYPLDGTKDQYDIFIDNIKVIHL